jgi:hypothetical protein
VRFIRERGYPAKWERHTHTYYDVDGRKYWTMGAPPERTVLINRADLEGGADLPPGPSAHRRRTRP